MGREASRCCGRRQLARRREGAKTLGLTTVWFRPPANEPIESATDEPELTGPITPDYSITRIPELLDLPILQDRA
jgi:FMN phosphatase YigB (HAD superfamily)